MPVDAILSREVVTVSPSTTLTKIRTLLHERGFHHLLVVDGEEDLCGVISEREVLQALRPFLDTHGEKHRDVLHRPASEIMRTDPETVEPDTSIESAARCLLDNNISLLPVLDGPTILGIVTTQDLVQHYTNHR